MDEQQSRPTSPAHCQPPICPHNGWMQPGPADYDDLSLIGVWRALVRRWKVILSAAILAVIAAAGYLLVATPQFEAEVVVLPPEAHHVEALNVPDIHEATAEDVYTIFARNLRSNTLRRQFFDENGLASVLGGGESGTDESVFRRRFSDRLKVRSGARDEKDLVFVTLQGEHPEHIVTWVNDFVRFAASRTIDDIVDGIHTRVANQREGLREQIDIARQWAKQRREDRLTLLEERLATLRDGRRREDRIVVLDEQIAIARELNIMDRDDARPLVVKEQSVGLSVNTAPEPLYLRGVNELTAEREALEKREDDDPFLPGLREIIAEMEVLRTRTNNDPFIPGLRDKEEQLAQLEAGLARLQGAASSIRPARIDRPATLPEAPASPKRNRILPLSLVGGMLLGVFAAFQLNALEQSRT